MLLLHIVNKYIERTFIRFAVKSKNSQYNNIERGYTGISNKY